MHEPTAPDTAVEIQFLRSEIKQWALGIRCVFVVINVLPLYYCTRLLLMTPKVEVIFEDMLGSQERIPLGTQMILRHWPILLAAVWLLAGLSMVLIFVLQKASHVWVTAVVSLFALIAVGHLSASLLLEPVVQIVANLSGGGQ